MPKYRIRLTGEALPGHAPERIAVGLREVLKVPASQIGALLPPAKVVVKRGLDPVQAARMQRALASVGLASCREVEPETAAPASTGAQPEAAASSAAAGTRADDPADGLAAALASGLPRQRPGLPYVLHLVLVTTCCVLVPLVYLAGVAAFGAALVWYLTHVYGFSHGRVYGFWGLFLFYVLPALSGGIVLLFLLRPVFAGRRGMRRQILLEADEEPRLRRAIGALAQAIGIPAPAAIALSNEVNASVQLENGWAGFWSGRTVLTLGLPLVAGLSGGQLLGVLAHEFGHCAQRIGMRGYFLINGVNAWLYRRAYEPDPWIVRLERMAADSDETLTRMVMVCARLGIAGSRRLLAGLFQLSFRLSRSLSRQMEFDADRYEVQLGGSAAFAATALRLRALARAFAEVDTRNAATWREDKLLRNIAQAVARQADGYDAATLTALRRQLETTITHHWDTHPADLARVQHAEALAAPGLYHDARPATALFEHFARHAEDASRAYYHAHGLDLAHVTFMDAEAIQNLGQQREEALEHLHAWSGRQWQPWPWLALHLPVAPELAALSAPACIAELGRQSPAITRDWLFAGKECGRREELVLAALLARHDLAYEPAPGEAFDEARHVAEYRQIVAGETPARQALRRVAGLYRQRLALALGAGSLDGEPLLALAGLYPGVESLREAYATARRLEHADTAAYPALERIREDAQVACKDFALQLLARCDGIAPGPFAAASIGAHLRQRCPAFADAELAPAACTRHAGLLLDGLEHVWKTVFAALARRCADAERRQGVVGIAAG